jgi:hypothetical protein
MGTLIMQIVSYFLFDSEFFCFVSLCEVNRVN